MRLQIVCIRYLMLFLGGVILTGYFLTEDLPILFGEALIVPQQQPVTTESARLIPEPLYDRAVDAKKEKLVQSGVERPVQVISKNDVVTGAVAPPAMVYTVPKPLTYTGDLDDHAGYQAFHQQREDALKQAFIDASRHKISQLHALLLKGRAANINDTQLAEAEAKIAVLQAAIVRLEKQLAGVGL